MVLSEKLSYFLRNMLYSEDTFKRERGLNNMQMIEYVQEGLYESGLIKKISFPTIIIETEEGKEIEIKATKKQKRDPLFWRALTDVWRAKIWIPFHVGLKQLRDSDWVVEMA